MLDRISPPNWGVHFGLIRSIKEPKRIKPTQIDINKKLSFTDILLEVSCLTVGNV